MDKEDAKSLEGQSGELKETAEVRFTDCNNTTHHSNDTVKNYGSDFEQQRDKVHILDVQPKHTLGLDYDSSSDSDDS